MTVLLSEIYPGKQSAVPADTHLLPRDGLALEKNEPFLLIKKLVTTQALLCSHRSLERVPPSFLQLCHRLLEGRDRVSLHSASDWPERPGIPVDTGCRPPSIGAVTVGTRGG